MKTKKISFTEYAYVLHAYPATVEISMEDFEKLETHQKNIQTIEEKFPSYHDKTSRECKSLEVEKENIKIILEKYGNADYDCSEPIYDETYTDSYEYDGEV